ncbi:MAG TPA: hypothetical protein VIF11_12850 [Methylomirabilota bacterium]|jgi:hypothetical protein
MEHRLALAAIDLGRAGSNEGGTRVVCTAHVIWSAATGPAPAASTGAGRSGATTTEASRVIARADAR